MKKKTNKNMKKNRNKINDLVVIQESGLAEIYSIYRFSIQKGHI